MAGCLLLAVLGASACSLGERLDAGGGGRNAGDVVAKKLPEGPAGPGSCDGATAAALDEAVAGQLDAFADADFGRALEFASTGFRRDVGEEEFAALIGEHFPVVATNDGHIAGACERDGDVATLGVVVLGAKGGEQALVYLFELELGEWRIGGAVPPGGQAPGSGVV